MQSRKGKETPDRALPRKHGPAVEKLMKDLLRNQIQWIWSVDNSIQEGEFGNETSGTSCQNFAYLYENLARAVKRGYPWLEGFFLPYNPTGQVYPLIPQPLRIALEVLSPNQNAVKLRKHLGLHPRVETQRFELADDGVVVCAKGDYGGGHSAISEDFEPIVRSKVQEEHVRRRSWRCWISSGRDSSAATSSPWRLRSSSLSALRTRTSSSITKANTG